VVVLAFVFERFASMTRILLAVVLLLALTVSDGTFTNGCMKCICRRESGCKPKPCAPDVGSDSCGPYQIKEPYWRDCGSPGANYRACALDMNCSERCVIAYMARYGARCVGNSRTPTCEDYARIHNGGPSGCKYSSTIGYGNWVSCCTKGLC